MDTFFNVLYNLFTSTAFWSTAGWLVLTVASLAAVLAPFGVVRGGSLFKKQTMNQWLNDLHPITGTLGMGYVLMSIVGALTAQGLFLLVVGVAEVAGFSGAIVPLYLDAALVVLLCMLVTFAVGAVFTIGPFYLVIMGFYELVRDFSGRDPEPSMTTRVWVTAIYWVSAAFLAAIDLAAVPAAILVFLTCLPFLFQALSLIVVNLPFFVS